MESSKRVIVIDMEEAPLLPATDWIEKMEDEIAELLAIYGCEGKIYDEITGNIVCFPLSNDENKEKL